ncbi:hypothetical protein [Pseudaeromonas paramecii]|uniref:Uncharacterized protein n=1 Tax=Pseudaeromonas paramecii TaxID=2138166 RepID=A0ABP8QD29_9GAMM
MSLITELTKGFMWGIGLSIALLSSVTAYVMHVYANAEVTFRDTIGQIYEERSTILSQELQAEVMKSEVKGNEILIFSRYKNIKVHSAAILGMKVKFTVFDAANRDGAPIAICSQAIANEESESVFIYGITSCKTMFGQSADAVDVTTSIVR